MARERRSESNVIINAKWSSFNFQALRFRDTGVVVEEGRFVVHDATSGFSRVAAPTDPYAYINFLVSSAASVSDVQTDPFDSSAPNQPLEAGGLSGVQGAGIEIGISKDRWYDISTYPPAVGKYVLITGAGGHEGKPFAAAGIPSGGVWSFGVITRLEGDVVFFLYDSIGTYWA